MPDQDVSQLIEESPICSNVVGIAWSGSVLRAIDRHPGDAQRRSDLTQGATGGLSDLPPLGRQRQVSPRADAG